nr:TonB-dependent receptor [Novosphingobium panipatense]
MFRSFTTASPLALAVSLAVTAPALAAEENAAPNSAAIDSAIADSGSGEAIVVTASRRRDENVQDVPIAISVISAATLERRGDYTLGSIQQQVPSLQVITYNPRNTNINIRGLGSNISLTNDGLENGVGFYIDNVYYGRVGLAQFDLVDLQGIEVLRGPQGTLFGKNTTSGVINVTSRKPSFDPELSAEASIGNYGFYQVRASGSAGIFKDLLAVRLSGAISENDGFLWNKTTNTRAQDYLNKSIRGQLLFTPDPDFEVRIIGDYAKQKQNHVLNVFAGLHTTYADGTTIANNWAQRAARFPGYTLPSFNAFDRVGEADSHYQSEMAGYGVSGEVNWNLGGPTLTSITAYRWWDWNPANDGDSTSLPIVTKAQQANRQRQFSQELRLASKSGGSFDYVIGAYYFWQIVRGYGASRYGPAAALWNLPNANQTIANAALDGFESNSTSTPETKTFAVFGQTDWHITDALTLTTGLRFTHEKKSGAFSQYWVDGADISGFTAAQQTAINAIRTQFNPVTSYATSFTDDSLSGLVTLNWKVAPDVNVYGSYSRGNKSGGLNLSVLPAGIDPDVKPEKVDAFELGVKSQFLDRRATFNAAGFWTEISDYQTTITDLPAGAVVGRQYISNIPKVRSRGIEGEFNIAPTDSLAFNASATYTDATYVTYRNAPQAFEYQNLGAIQDLSGARLPGVPKWAWTIGADFNTVLGELGGKEVGIYAHADYAYRTNFNTSASNSAWAQIPGFGIANGRIGLRTEDGLWDFSIWAKNLFDEDYFVSLSAANTGAVTAQVGEPRTFGATLRTKL